MKLKRYSHHVRRLVVFFIFSTLSFSSWAVAPVVALKLNFIEKIKNLENMGDELYFHITEYSSLSTPVHTLVPEYPINWVSAYLAEVKNVTLWQRALKEGEAVELAISLTERDAPPWNLDDLVGTVKVKFRRDGKQLIQEWSSLTPYTVLQPKPVKHPSNEKQFVLGEGSYQLGLILSE